METRRRSYQVIKTSDELVVVGMMRRRTASGPHTHASIVARYARCIEFANHIGNKEDILTSFAQPRCDTSIAYGSLFCPNSGVKIVVNIWTEVTAFAVREQILLSQDAAGRKDRDFPA